MKTNVASQFEFKQPDVLQFDGATQAEQDIAAQYCRVRFILVCGESDDDCVPDAHTAWLKVNHQSFRLDGYHDTMREAEWMCWQIAKAMLAFKAAQEPAHA